MSFNAEKWGQAILQAARLACRCRRCPGDLGADGYFHVVDASGVELFSGLECQCIDWMREQGALPYVVHFVGTSNGQTVVGGFSRNQAPEQSGAALCFLLFGWLISLE